MSTRARKRVGFVGAIKIDIQRLHGAWMELIFPQQQGRGHSVMGKWKPKTTPQRIAYKLWSAIGLIGLLALYPLTVMGFATRYYANKIDSTITRIGIVGVTAIALVLWGALTAVARVQLETGPFLAIAAASFVATLSTALAAICSKYGGRPLSVALAYPFAMTALFLPPVVAALVTPALEPYVLAPSYDFAVWILDSILFVGGLNEWFRTNFSLEGIGYVLMWLALSFPLGWFFGFLVELANIVRPSDSTT